MDPETNPVQNVPDVQANQQSSGIEMSDGADSPMSAFITMGIVAMLNLLILASTLFKNYNPNKSSFAFMKC